MSYCRYMESEKTTSESGRLEILICWHRLKTADVRQQESSKNPHEPLSFPSSFF
jgi:hypothetical protein